MRRRAAGAGAGALLLLVALPCAPVVTNVGAAATAAFAVGPAPRARARGGGCGGGWCPARGGPAAPTFVLPRAVESTARIILGAENWPWLRVEQGIFSLALAAVAVLLDKETDWSGAQASGRFYVRLIQWLISS